MEKTENYRLNQWDAQDAILREDFNADNAKIDAALAAGAKIASGSYVGTGTYGADNPNSLTFEFEPKIIIVTQSKASSASDMFLALRGQTGYTHFGSSGSYYNGSCTWDGNTVSWWCDNEYGGAPVQFNTSRATYCYLAVG